MVVSADIEYPFRIFWKHRLGVTHTVGMEAFYYYISFIFREGHVWAHSRSWCTQLSLCWPFTTILGISFHFPSSVPHFLYPVSSSFLLCFSFLWWTEGLSRPSDTITFLVNNRRLPLYFQELLNNGRETARMGRSTPGMYHCSEERAKMAVGQDFE